MASLQLLRCLALGAALVASAAHGQGERALADLINDYRSADQTCEGTPMPMVGTLVPSEALAQVRLAPGEDPAQALRQAGYQASRISMMSISGSSQPGPVMAMLEERYCRALLEPRYSEIGVSRDGATWRIVLAQPLIAADLGDWRQAGEAVLDRVNAARGQARTCGNQRFEPAASLGWSEQLAEASRAHSRDMANQNYFSHDARDGSTAADRAQRQGYRWQRVGENIAAGQGSPDKAVAGWLASPGHCANIMNPDFTEMGAAYASNPDSDMGVYWTQVFGTPAR